MELPATEARADDAPALDRLTPAELAAVFHRHDQQAVAAVGAVQAEVARAIALARDALAAGGRVVLVGAGTSGRLAVIEAAECIPTFSSERVVGLLAGGPAAFVRAREGAEDDRAQGGVELGGLAPTGADLVIGVTASGRTPFVFGALEAARAAGATTALVCCSPPAEPGLLDLAIVLPTGPEALNGSTRMKAGTATKCVLNAITTGAMALRGKVLDDLMVDVVASNAKLVQRARRIVATAVPTSPERAAELIEAAGGAAKVAIAMGRLGVDADAARARLEAAGGHLRRALDGAAGTP